MLFLIPEKPVGVIGRHAINSHVKSNLLRLGRGQHVRARHGCAWRGREKTLLFFSGKKPWYLVPFKKKKKSRCLIHSFKKHCWHFLKDNLSTDIIVALCQFSRDFPFTFYFIVYMKYLSPRSFFLDTLTISSLLSYKVYFICYILFFVWNFFGHLYIYQHIEKKSFQRLCVLWFIQQQKTYLFVIYAL
jgi:hypothetical protein